MIFALAQPAILLGLLVGFLVGAAATASAQRSLQGARPWRRRRMHSIGRARQTPAHWSTYLDPYGAVAALLAGVGWGARPPAIAGVRRAGPGPVVASVVVHGVLAAAGFAGYVAIGGLRSVVHVVSLSDMLHGSGLLDGRSVGEQILLGFGAINLACGLLSLVPIPPLELGVWVWSRAPRSPGARRIAYHLLEEAWGVGLVLVLLLLPLAGRLPALLAVLDAAADPLLRLI